MNKRQHNSLIFLIFVLFSSYGFASERILIPGGSFNMGCSLNDPDCGKDEDPTGGIRVHVPDFFIDKREFSVKDFHKCMAMPANGYTTGIPPVRSRSCIQKVI